MGAYGAALYAMSKGSEKKSTVLNQKQLSEFKHTIKVAGCGMCQNNCRLTVNTFADGRRFIAGNRCERPITKKSPDKSMNMYDYKLQLLQSYEPKEGSRGKIGLPMGLNMYEMLPFWHTFLSSLGFEVVTSGISDKKVYSKGNKTIPSDSSFIFIKSFLVPLHFLP